jgi:hypothetical protein
MSSWTWIVDESPKNEFTTKPSNKTVLAEVKSVPISVMIPWGTPTIAPEGDIRVKIGAEDELPPPPVEPPPPVPPLEPPFVPAPELDADPPPPHPVTTIAAQMMREIVTIRDPIVMD